MDLIGSIWIKLHGLGKHGLDKYGLDKHGLDVVIILF